VIITCTFSGSVASQAVELSRDRSDHDVIEDMGLQLPSTSTVDDSPCWTCDADTSCETLLCNMLILSWSGTPI